jgi:hypothetical protein
MEVGEEATQVGGPHLVPLRQGRRRAPAPQSELLEVVGVGAEGGLGGVPGIAKLGQEGVNELVHRVIGLPYGVKVIQRRGNRRLRR